CTCYCRAAAQGHSLAQFALGLRHDNGQDVPQDYAAAWEWYALAARQGHARAQFNLGLMAASGQGGPLDLQQAYIWLSMAAAAGVAGAEKSLRQTAARMRETDLLQVRQRLEALAD
ncbi:MAG: tetratricopeptide repeat protein, partial [Janthinobacterium sp.]